MARWVLVEQTEGSFWRGPVLLPAVLGGRCDILHSDSLRIASSNRSERTQFDTTLSGKKLFTILAGIRSSVRENAGFLRACPNVLEI